MYQYGIKKMGQHNDFHSVPQRGPLAAKIVMRHHFFNPMRVQSGYRPRTTSGVGVMVLLLCDLIIMMLIDGV